MLAWLEQFLVRYPELALFLVIALGYRIGSVKLGGFSLGPVTGSLFAGLIVGQFAHIPVSGMTKSFLFLLFLFGTGYSVGPQFMQSLQRDGLKPILLAIVVCMTALGVSILTARLLGLDAGFAAGLLSGALTQSAAMGTATDAINGLALPEADRARLVAHIGVADAVCYLFGSAGAILFVSTLAPALLRIDLKAEALKLEDALGMTRAKAGVASAWRKFELRAYRLPTGSPLIAATIAEAEARMRGHRLFIVRIRRGGQIIEPTPDLELDASDVVAISGPRHAIVEVIGPRADEVDDKDLLDVPVTVADVLLTNEDAVGQSLAEEAKQDWTHGIYLRSVSRGGHDLPIVPGLVLERGDLLRLVGPEPVVQAAGAQIGTIVAPSSAIDFVVLGLAIFAGGVAGVLLSFTVGGMTIALGTSVGTLLAGLLIGHLRTRHPLFGRIPDGAVALMTSLGLAAFVGLTGIHAGPIFLSALIESGIGLLLGGMAVTLAPLLAGLLFGHFALRMHPILLLGALAGAQTVTAAMAAVQERSESPVAVLGYTPAYPVSNVLLTTWGTIIVMTTAG